MLGTEVELEVPHVLLRLGLGVVAAGVGKTERAEDVINPGLKKSLEKERLSQLFAHRESAGKA